MGQRTLSFKSWYMEFFFCCHQDLKYVNNFTHSSRLNIFVGFSKFWIFENRHIISLKRKTNLRKRTGGKTIFNGNVPTKLGASK